MGKNLEVSEHVLISGGSRGLGLALTKGLLDHGYIVSTFSRRKTSAIEELEALHPGKIKFVEFDLASEEVSKLVKSFVDSNGPIFSLINNAAVVQEGVLMTLPEIEIEKMIAVDLTNSIKLTRMALRYMMQLERAKIVNVSSIVGSRGYNGLSVYSACKAGLDGFSRSLARELGRRQITVNSLAPGYMETDMSSGLNDIKMQQIVNRTPLGRLATVNDIVGVLLFMLSPAADFITGQVITVDGGITC